MRGKRLFNAIGNIFSEKRRIQKKREKELRSLLGKLKKYQAKLEKDLDGTSNNKKIRQLKGEVTVVKKKRKQVHKLLNSF